MARRVAFGVLLTLVLLALSACSGQAPAARKGGKLRVIATTTIVGDVVRQIGGDAIDLTVLLPAGADPHSFEPTPKDVARVAEAQVVLANGAGLEGFVEFLLRNAGGQTEVVHVSEGITLRTLEPEADGHGDAEAEHDHEGADPHVWMDPNNVIIWTQNIEATLSRLDPDSAATYQANAAAYRKDLQALDAWIRDQVAQIPAANRKLVTDHQMFGYLAGRYGFEQVGAVLPGFSTRAEPSPQDLAALEDAIRHQGVQAVFVSVTVNSSLAERVTQDTGTRLVHLYTGSLSRPGGEADNYLDYMRYNVRAIVEALR